MRRAPKKKPTYHHGDLRRALLDAALALVGEGGIDALTLREAARRAGVSHNAPYRHFADKEALLVAIATEGFERLADALAAAESEAPDDFERFVGGGEAYVTFALENAAHYRVMFGPTLANKIGQHPDLDVVGMRAFKGLLDHVERAEARGLLPGDRPADAVAMTMWAYVHGLAMLVLDGHLPLDPDAARALVRGTATTMTRA
ncbi:MAG: TetR/AcrR family transcriptional regulator [Deltaproteobacteria bacterium]